AIDALLHIGGQSGAVLPLGEDAAALRRLAETARQRLERMPRRFQVIGPRAAVASLVDAFARSGLTPRLQREQVYMALLPGALPEDAELVHRSGAQLRLEELEEDPRLADPEGYRRRVEEECRDGHTYLWRGDGELRFRASVSALTADAAQVSGVYTPPEQ